LIWGANDHVYDAFAGAPHTATVALAGTTVISVPLETRSMNVAALLGQEVTLTITREGSWSSDVDSAPSISGLIFLSNQGTPLVGAIPNGNFIDGLDGWTVAPAAEVQNVTAAAQTLGGLTVTRSFFTIPNRTWARSVDTFTNNTAATITATATYASNLGSDSSGAIFTIDGVALSSWDLSRSDLDVGMLFGAGATLTFTSASGTRATADENFGVTGGDDDFTASYALTVEPGETVSLAIFTVMDPARTADTGALTSDARPAGVEATIATIRADIGTDGQYLTGMTQAQIDALQNF
jgi:hypothetical protein